MSDAVWVAGAAVAPAEDYDADIIILALDRADETLAAIASALSQTGLSRHIFVLDQGSRQETRDRFAAAVADRADATLLASPGNLGVAGGRNLAAAQGRGRAIIALDNDAVFATADTAARMVAALDADPSLAAVGCRIVAHDTGSDDLPSWGYPVSLLPRAGESFDAVTYVGAGHALRREAWQMAGGYDAKLFFCWEEYDFCLRAIALGWRVRYRGDLVILHKVSGERRIGWTAQRWFFFVRNRLYIERKLGRTWMSLAPRAAGYLMKGLRFGLLGETCRALVAARRMSPSAGRRGLPGPASDYLATNDLAHRGSLLGRFRREVLSRPGSVASAAER
jgi:GT2 family glycosyltransferase